MSAIKKIVIIFNRNIKLSELTRDFMKLSESKFFGLTGEYWEFYSETFKEQISIPLGFINLNGKKYDLFTEYYPAHTDNAIRMVAFENDASDFYDDFLGYSWQNGENVKELIKLLKEHLSYYSMTLFTYHHWSDCPHTDELLNMYNNGTLNDGDGKCYLILG